MPRALPEPLHLPMRASTGLGVGPLRLSAAVSTELTGGGAPTGSGPCARIPGRLCRRAEAGGRTSGRVSTLGTRTGLTLPDHQFGCEVGGADVTVVASGHRPVRALATPTRSEGSQSTGSCSLTANFCERRASKGARLSSEQRLHPVGGFALLARHHVRVEVHGDGDPRVPKSLHNDPRLHALSKE